MATTQVLRAYLCIIICFHFLYNCESTVAIISLDDLVIPSRSNNFIRQNYQQYNNTVSILDVYLSEFRVNYFDRIETLQLNEEFLQQELNKALLQLNPLDALDDVHSYCVHKYRTSLPDVTITKNNLISCKEKAINAYTAMVAAPTTTIKNLKTYYAHQFANELKTCASRHLKNETVHVECLLKTVKASNTVTTTNVKNFHNQLKQALCTAKAKIQETFDCHSPIVFDTISKIGEIIGLLESCVAGREFCPTNNEDATFLGGCPYHMSLHLGSNNNVLRQDEMQQILSNVGKTTPCLQVNFIRKA